MVQWTDKAIVLATQGFGESSAIITVFTQHYGVRKGLVKGIKHKRQRGLYAIGNVMDITWKARLADQLGFFSGELVFTPSIGVLGNKLKLTSLITLCSLLHRTLPEHDAHTDTYNRTEYFIHALTNSSQFSWLPLYILIEMDILSYLGFRLELHLCGATGSTDNLIYVSPKTGRAICEDAGTPYHDKLLSLPALLCELIQYDYYHLPHFSHFSVDELRKSLALTGFFLNKCLTTHYGVKVPSMRSYLMSTLEQQAVTPMETA